MVCAHVAYYDAQPGPDNQKVISQTVLDRLNTPASAPWCSPHVVAVQLELESAEAECILDAARSEADYEAQQRIVDSICLTAEQLAALKQVLSSQHTPCVVSSRTS